MDILTDPQRIRALITRLESGHVGREESDEYLVLDGWVINHDTHIAISPSTTGEAFSGPNFDNRPCPTTNAQDSLDSLPDGWVLTLTRGKHASTAVLTTTQGEKYINHQGLSGAAAAAICLARLNMELAKLEGG